MILHNFSQRYFRLGKNDLQTLVDDGHAEVCCHFCNEKYEFTGEELQAIFDESEKRRK